MALRTSSFSRADGLSVLVLNVLMKTQFLHDRNLSLLPSLSDANHSEEFGDAPSLVRLDGRG